MSLVAWHWTPRLLADPQNSRGGIWAGDCLGGEGWRAPALGYQFGWYSLALFGTALLSGGVAFSLWRRRTSLGAIHLLLLELAVAQWALAIAFEGAATTLGGKLLWSKIGYLGTTSTPLLFFLFATEYSQRGRGPTRFRIVLLSVIPLLTILLAAMNEWHHWVWTDVSLSGDGNLATYTHGIWFWVFAIYSYGLIGVGMVSLYRAMYRFPSFYRPQMWSLLVGCAVPFAGNMVYLSGLNPLPGVDWTPVTFALTGVILAWGLFRLRMFNLVPVARSLLIEKMVDGILVLDARDHVVDINPAAERIIGRPQNKVVGQQLTRVVPLESDRVSQFLGANEGRAELSLGQGSARGHYDVRLSPIQDPRGQPVGRLIVLRDITQRKRMEEERELLLQQLQSTLAEIRQLTGLLPICAHCKRIRDDQGYWQNVEVYVRDHSDAEFSHGICPVCMQELYPDLLEDEEPSA